MTYREKVQEFAEQIWALYNKANAMRDQSFDHAPFNEVRGHLYNAAQAIEKHDNALSHIEALSEWGE